MATIEPYQTKKGTRYRVRYRTADHKLTDKRGFTTQREAKKFAAAVEVAIQRGEYITPTDARTPLKDVAKPWLAAREGTLKPSSYASAETAWRVHIAPKWGEVAIGKITKAGVQTWVSELAKSASPSLVRRVHSVLVGILERAVDERLVITNHARGVALPRRRQSHRPYLTISELEAVADNAGERGDLVRLLGYVGLRWSEAIALRGRHLDAQRGRLTIVENAVQTGSAINVGTPKTHEQRSVPVPAFLMDVLKARVDGPEGLLFGQGSTGYPQRPSSKRSWFKTAVKAAQREHKTMPTITLHDLRHSAASIAVHAGANVKAVQRMLGHASAAMTLDVYADLFDADLDLVAANIDTARAANCGQKMGKTPRPQETMASTPA